MISVSLSEVSILVTVIFFGGIVLGMLLYRVLWHVDTAVLRAEVSALRLINGGLQTEIVRLSSELRRADERISELEITGRSVQSDLHAALRR
ncbi:MAG TPA: hypothetical protein PL105_09690 [Caldilineaceae bacterium]|nr:hypothetical protein [Caldilineaceae bacterium]